MKNDVQDSNNFQSLKVVLQITTCNWKSPEFLKQNELRFWILLRKNKYQYTRVKDVQPKQTNLAAISAESLKSSRQVIFVKMMGFVPYRL